MGRGHDLICAALLANEERTRSPRICVFVCGRGGRGWVGQTTQVASHLCRDAQVEGGGRQLRDLGTANWRRHPGCWPNLKSSDSGEELGWDILMIRRTAIATLDTHNHQIDRIIQNGFGQPVHLMQPCHHR